MSRQEALFRLRRHAVYLLGAITLAMWMGASFASVALAAGAQPSASGEMGLTVSAGSVASVGGWMPGDSGLVQVIELRATGDVRYEVRLSCSGSQELAETLVVTVTDSSGAVSYTGPLAGAEIGVPSSPADARLVLTDGQSEVLSISAEMPLGATQETAGTELEFTAVVSWYPAG